MEVRTSAVRFWYVTPSVFYYSNYVFHNLIRFFCVKIAKSYTWFLMNADKFYGFLFIHDQLSDNYPTHMDSIIENQHFGLTPFSPPDLNTRHQRTDQHDRATQAGTLFQEVITLQIVQVNRVGLESIRVNSCFRYLDPHFTQ